MGVQAYIYGWQENDELCTQALSEDVRRASAYKVEEVQERNTVDVWGVWLIASVEAHKPKPKPIKVSNRFDALAVGVLELRCVVVLPRASKHRHLWHSVKYYSRDVGSHNTPRGTNGAV